MALIAKNNIKKFREIPTATMCRSPSVPMKNRAVAILRISRNELAPLGRARMMIFFSLVLSAGVILKGLNSFAFGAWERVVILDSSDELAHTGLLICGVACDDFSLVKQDLIGLKNLCKFIRA